MELDKIYQGHALRVLKKLPAESIDCVVTSPPYWALRDYGVADQIGLESTFQEYVVKLCNIFDEIKRVLKGPGSLWVNLGDTYNNLTPGSRDPHRWPKQSRNDHKAAKPKISYPQKSLCLIPERFVIEMVDRRGWIARNDIVWSKNNPMPESVRDRCTKSHEYVYFFTKNQTYYFDQDAIREPYSEVSLPRALRGLSAKNKWKDGAPGSTANSISQPRLNVRKQFKREYGGGGSSFVGHSGYRTADGRLLINPLGRNKWTVWQVSTASYRGAHFATFPESLIEPMIKAGCPQGGVILDPFMGSGTTAVVAKRLSRNFVGIELNPKYIEIAEKRISGDERTRSKFI